MAHYRICTQPLVHTTYTNKQVTLEGLHTPKFVFCEMKENETKRNGNENKTRFFKCFPSSKVTVDHITDI